MTLDCTVWILGCSVLRVSGNRYFSCKQNSYSRYWVPSTPKESVLAWIWSLLFHINNLSEKYGNGFKLNICFPWELAGNKLILTKSELSWHCCYPKLSSSMSNLGSLTSFVNKNASQCNLHSLPQLPICSLQQTLCWEAAKKFSRK